MRFILVLFILFSFAPLARAEAPRESLIGSWFFKRGIGHPCQTLILALEYHFMKDGSYRTWARMKGSGEFKFSGTYKATDVAATAYVDGHTIGPYPYTIKDGVLRITQPENGCAVELEKE